jgi:hypothetical protein
MLSIMMVTRSVETIFKHKLIIDLSILFFGPLVPVVVLLVTDLPLFKQLIARRSYWVWTCSAFVGLAIPYIILLCKLMS